MLEVTQSLDHNEQTMMTMVTTTATSVFDDCSFPHVYARMHARYKYVSQLLVRIPGTPIQLAHFGGNAAQVELVDLCGDARRQWRSLVGVDGSILRGREAGAERLAQGCRLGAAQSKGSLQRVGYIQVVRDIDAREHFRVDAGKHNAAEPGTSGGVTGTCRHLASNRETMENAHVLKITIMIYDKNDITLVY